MNPHNLHPSGAKSAPSLDLEQIVQAALALLDEAGFDGLTMRSLADRLGIKAASLYWHVRGKQELLSLMANEIIAPMRAPDRSLPWQAQLEALGRDYRQALLHHHDAARVLAASGAPTGPNMLRLSELVLRALLDAGFDRKDAVYAGSLINDYVVMFVLEETRRAEVPAEPAYGFAGLSPDEYPSLAGLADELMTFEAEERFRFGAEILTSGLERRLAKRKASDPLQS
jgi:TetR/AcrR family tetracycline transcriptional repressor